MLIITRETVQCFCRICLEEVVGTPSSEPHPPPIHDLLKDDNLIDWLFTVTGTEVNQWRDTTYCPSTVCDACFTRVAKLYKFRDKMMCTIVAVRQIVLKNLNNGDVLYRLQRFCRVCLHELEECNEETVMSHEWMCDLFAYRFSKILNQPGEPRMLCNACDSILLEFKECRQQAQDSFKILLDLLSEPGNTTVKYTIVPVEVEEAFGDPTSPNPKAIETGEANVQIEAILPAVEKNVFLVQELSDAIAAEDSDAESDKDDGSKLVICDEKAYLDNDNNSGLDEETLMQELLDEKSIEQVDRLKLAHDNEQDSDFQNNEKIDNNLRASNHENDSSIVDIKPVPKRKKVSFGDIQYRTIGNRRTIVDDLEFLSDGNIKEHTIDIQDVKVLINNNTKVVKKIKEQNAARRKRGNKSLSIKAENKISPGKVIQCEQCDKQFRKEVIYNAHVLNVHKGVQKPFGCDQCDKVYRLYHYLQRHIRETHGIKVEINKNGAVVPQALAPHACGVCDKSFKRKEHLSEHLRSVHQGLRPHQCQYCEKSFGARKTCRIHEMGHTGAKPFQCTICQKAFRQITDLKIHMESHNTPADRLCPICKRAKESPEELQRHLREHEKAMCHKCDECGRIFKKRSQLNAHIDAVHLKLRPHKCSYCDMSFAIPKTCRTHELVHTGARPEVCPICSKAFRQISSLRSHLKTHNKQAKPKTTATPKKEPDVKTDDEEEFIAN